MRPQDKSIFKDAAKTLNLWILVRATNGHSLKYIGMAGYKPKGIDCKAKTAYFDIGNVRLAGLVTSPFIQPKAFTLYKLPDAKMQWKKMEYLIGGAYKIDNLASSK